MKRLSSRHLPRLVAEVQVTPWLDLLLMCVLVMLVLLAAGMQERSAAAPADALAGVVPTVKMELRVAKDLKLTLAGKGVEHQALIGELSRQVAAAPDLGVVVVIPPSLTAPQLMQVMDALRCARIRHTAVVVSPAPPH